MVCTSRRLFGGKDVSRSNPSWETLATMHESLGDGVAPRGCKIAACVVLALPIPSPLRPSYLWSRDGLTSHAVAMGFSSRSCAALVHGTHPAGAARCDELYAACATVAPVPPRRADSRIIARTRFMTFSYHKRTFQNKRRESSRAAWSGPSRRKQTISIPNTDDSSYQRHIPDC